MRCINPRLGWIEWCDTNDNPGGWREPAFDDSEWPKPGSSRARLPVPGPARLGHVRQIRHSLTSTSRGKLAENLGYEKDDVSARFFLRHLEPTILHEDGVW